VCRCAVYHSTFALRLLTVLARRFGPQQPHNVARPLDGIYWTGMHYFLGITQPPLSQGTGWLPNPPPQPDVDWQAQAVIAQQRRCTACKAKSKLRQLHRRPPEPARERDPAASGPAAAESGTPGPARVGRSSGGGESAGSSNAVDQLRQESDLMSSSSGRYCAQQRLQSLVNIEKALAPF
jgi:hypothetical protein